jgi:hypothetical protein
LDAIQVARPIWYTLVDALNNNVMHAKPDLDVLFNDEINRSGSVITAVITLRNT